MKKIACLCFIALMLWAFTHELVMPVFSYTGSCQCVSCDCCSSGCHCKTAVCNPAYQPQFSLAGEKFLPLPASLFLSFLRDNLHGSYAFEINLDVFHPPKAVRS
jgi:hypothetical protein